MRRASGSFDVLILGGGHNGLVCAFYLARASRRVCVLEAHEVVGGAAVTEEFHPGFRNSVASYTVGLLTPEIVAEMDLHAHGLALRLRPAANFVPSREGASLLLHNDTEASCAEIARHSAADAKRYPEYLQRLGEIAAVLAELARRTPPDPAGGIGDMLGLLREAARMRRLGREGLSMLGDLLGGSAGHLLDSWFESDLLKAALGFDAVVGNNAGPYAAGSGYVLLHHVFGETLGVRGAWGHAIGGMGAITQAMARACEAQGVTIRCGAKVAQVLVEQGRCTGVRLVDGETLHAPRIAAAINPRLLCTELLPAETLPPAFAQRMAHWRCDSASLRVNLALRELPIFTARPGRGAHLGAGIIMAPSLAHMEHAWLESRLRGWPQQPVVEMLLPSVIDDSLAPPGQHVASLFCQFFPYDLAGARHWDEVREQALEDVLAWVEGFAPGLRSSILAVQLLTPLDLERRFGLTRGDIFHGAMSLDQLWSLRPALGHAGYRLPVAGLYLCGAGAHPGGGVTGLPGRAAARAMLAD
jgi:phytoene dehydrogenase-like protein